MKSRAVLILLAVAGMNLFGPRASEAAQRAAAPGTPDAVVRDLYKVHRMGHGPVFEGKSRSHLDKFFDRRLADMIWKELTSNSDEVGNLDFDPLYNAQEIGIKNFRVGAPRIENGKAVVAVTFNNYDRREKLLFHLLRAGGLWKVENVVYEGGSDLLKILSTPH
ncbi:MAG TPA: DUF3828 domain-containing protein [Blastocatellia bacterium]|nr:DUF3828 domain-containing protein [Blastocatellia bacterium]